MSLNRTFSRLAIVFVALSFLGISFGCTKKNSAKENVLNNAITANLKGMDPIYANDLYSNQVIANIYEPLFEYHYLKRPLELQPLVAAAMPTASKDGLTHTIKIKKGIKFQLDVIKLN